MELPTFNVIAVSLLFLANIGVYFQARKYARNAHDEYGCMLELQKQIIDHNNMTLKMLEARGEL